MFRQMRFKLGAALSAVALLTVALPAQAEPTGFDIDEGHTFVTFKVSHIGFAWIPGAFTDFNGELVYDAENRANSKVTFTVETPSLATWHAERDKHLQSGDFLDAGKYPTAKFVSTAYEPTGENTAILRGNLTLHGVTKPVEFEVNELAARKDPWGSFRRAFEAKTEIALADFNISTLNGAVETAEVSIALEATRK